MIDIVVRESATADVVAVGLGPEGPLLEGVPDTTLPPTARTMVTAFAAESGPAGPPGEVRELPLPGQRPGRVLLMATGEGGPDDLRTGGAGLARAAKSPSLAVTVPGFRADQVGALIEGVALGAYRFSVRANAATKSELASVEVLAAGATHELREAIDHARTLAAATVWARDLAGPTDAGLLVAIDNGLGKIQRFEYTASAQLAWSAEAAGEAWTERMPVSIAVTTTQRHTLASGEPDRTSLLAVRDDGSSKLPLLSAVVDAPLEVGGGVRRLAPNRPLKVKVDMPRRTAARQTYGAVAHHVATLIASSFSSSAPSCR